MNITFLGVGYVGLVSGIMMAYLGHNVICLDIDEFKISQLKKNILPIYEPGLDEYLLFLIQSGKLKFIDKYNSDLQNSDAVFITVDTPALPSGATDLRAVWQAIDNVSIWIKDTCLIIIKSTVPPTTCNQIILYLAKKKLTFPIAVNPEFLREGCAINDFLNPDRIVIGTYNKYIEELVKKIYLPLIQKNIPIVTTDLVTAELIKYASNAFLATKIAFTNEMANLCEKIGANSKHLSLGMGSDTRIGQEFLRAGPGFGGSCFPKDIMALVQLAQNYESDCKVLDAVISANNQRASDMVDKITHIVGNNVHDKLITILGLTFKANTDDIRNSPAIKIIKLLLSKGATISTFDPAGMSKAMQYFKYLNCKKLLYADSATSACQDSDVIVVTTEWPEFQTLNWQLIYDQVKSPIIIDLRNFMDVDIITSKGFQYYSIGMRNIA